MCTKLAPVIRPVKFHEMRQRKCKANFILGLLGYQAFQWGIGADPIRTGILAPRIFAPAYGNCILSVSPTVSPKVSIIEVI